MSQENVESLLSVIGAATPEATDMAHVVRDDAAWAAFSQAIGALVTPDFVYEDNVMPDHAGEMYRGMEGYRRAVMTYAEPFEAMVYVFERAVGSGDHVVSIHRVRATARHTGIEFELQAAYVWRFRGGRVVHILGFLDPEQALEAVGLAE